MEGGKAYYCESTGLCINRPAAFEDKVLIMINFKNMKLLIKKFKYNIDFKSEIFGHIMTYLEILTFFKLNQFSKEN